jgi:8-hydroxy-5-deazaflavin:NADPH oxidoreductase
MSSEHAETPSLGFVGGTGPEGRGLALRFAQAGFHVAIGSRSADRAREAAGELRAVLSHADVSAGTNQSIAQSAEVVLLTIPYSGLRDTLPGLAGELTDKIVVSAVAPVEFREGRPVAVHVEAGSAAQEVQELLPKSRIVSGFQTVDAHALQEIDHQPDTDVIICSDDVEARRSVVRWANRIEGIRALSGGRLSASRYVEECTALLIVLNRIYKTHSGIRFTGINR